jgi:YD repeat-containing protein
MWTAGGSAKGAMPEGESNRGRNDPPAASRRAKRSRVEWDREERLREKEDMMGQVQKLATMTLRGARSRKMEEQSEGTRS